MPRLKMFSRRDKAAMKRLHEETSSAPIITRSDVLLKTHGEKDFNFNDVSSAMKEYADIKVMEALEKQAIECQQKVQTERDFIRQMVYDAIPTGETTAWDCIKAFKQLIVDIDNRDNITNED